MMIKKVRDLTLISIDKEKVMVVACDGAGGIGKKEGDTFKTDPFYAAKFTARVALMEVICCKAKIVTLTNVVCNEMEPTGSRVIEGITKELEALGLNINVLNGSTEENFKTLSTGIGVTVIGLANTNEIKVNKAKDNDIIISLGLPKLGTEMSSLDYDSEIVNYNQINKLLEMEDVHEIVPVGSKGILYESEKLAENNSLNLILKNNLSIDIRRTAGPASVIIASIDESILHEVSGLGIVNVIGRLNK
ncbi:AIR synthase related protein [Clostridium rectalis]|uniref:AIR synthase related protein n=1 Tax=Clostridium rectalis TaxID=2040295 RepID=UPI000F637059|nr:AIR synthase related protein [Clostridium rectalis]